MENLYSLPGDNAQSIPLDPMKEDFVLPDTLENDKFDLPDKDSVLLQTYAEASQFNPDEAAKVQSIARKLDENPAFIQKNLSGAEKFINSPDSSYWNEYEKRFPESAKFLADKKNMAISHDDHEAIGKVEKKIQDMTFMSQLSRAWDKGLLNVSAGNIGMVPALFDMAKQVNKDYIGSDAIGGVIDQTAKEYKFDKVVEFTKKINELNNSLPLPDQDIINKAAEGDYGGAAKGMALSFAQNAPNQIQNLMMAASGLGTAGLVLTGVQQAGSTWLETADTKAGTGARLTNAVGSGVIESAFESLGTFGLFNNWEKELAKKVGKEGAKKISIQAMKLLAAQTIGEGNEEFWTSVAQDTLAGYVTGVDPTKKEGILNRAANAGIVGAFSGATMSSPTAFIQANIKMREAKKAELMSKAYVELGDTIEQTKTKGRDTEISEMLTDAQVKGSAMENVFVSAEAFKDYYQSKNLDPSQIAEKLGVKDQLNEALESGSDIKIPLAKWHSNLDSESYQAFKDDVKFDENSMSPKQIKAHTEEINQNLKVLDEQASKLVNESVDIKSAYQEIHDDLYGQLINTGMKDNVAKASAKIASQAMVTQAVNAGQDPLEFYQEKRLRIVSGDSPLSYQRSTIQKFDSKEIVGEDQIKKALTELNLPEIYQHDESISAIRQVLSVMKGEIDAAEAGQRSTAQMINPEDGQGYTKTVNTSTQSTFPAWFGENFKTKKDFMKVISKGNSKFLAPLVSQAIKALKEGHGENPQFAISPNLDFVSLVDPQGLQSSLSINQEMNKVQTLEQGQRPEALTRKDIRSSVESKLKGKQVVIISDENAAAASMDQLTGQLTINSKKVKYANQLDEILSQFGEAKRGVVSGKISLNINGENHELDASKTVKALAAKLYKLERLIECSRG